MSQEKNSESVTEFIKEARLFLENLPNKSIKEIKKMHKTINAKTDFLDRVEDLKLLYDSIKTLKLIKCKLKTIIDNYNSSLQSTVSQ